MFALKLSLMWYNQALWHNNHGFLIFFLLDLNQFFNFQWWSIRSSLSNSWICFVYCRVIPTHWTKLIWQFHLTWLSIYWLVFCDNVHFTTFRFLKNKVSGDSTDFETQLYLCNEAFKEISNWKNLHTYMQLTSFSKYFFKLCFPEIHWIIFQLVYVVCV